MPHRLLILEPTGQRSTRTEAQGRELYARMQRFGEDLQARGKLQALASQSQGVRVRTGGGGKPQVLDGPFAEAREMVGGFFLLRCESMAEAMAMHAGPAAGLLLMAALQKDKSLCQYHWLPSVRGDLLARLGRDAEARAEFERAARLAGNAREKAFLQERARLLASFSENPPG